MPSFDTHISESALLVNESRARNVALSGDVYAHLWVTGATRSLWEAFSRDVYPHDAIELGVRNRFFLTGLASFVNHRRDPVFVNVGAGFTSYPFLVDARCRTIEIDFPHVIDVKRARLDAWRRDGILPARDVDFLAADLARPDDIGRIEDELASRIAGAPSFILMEGLTYYLSNAALDSLLGAFAALQAADSLLAFDFWTPDTADHPTFIRLRHFFSERFGHAESCYNPLTIEAIREIPGYALEIHTDVQKLEHRYLGTNVLADYDAILPEHYVLLKRTV
jgi:O-methyltransferase involved in polyketide biosynthesis